MIISFCRLPFFLAPLSCRLSQSIPSGVVATASMLLIVVAVVTADLGLGEPGAEVVFFAVGCVEDPLRDFTQHFLNRGPINSGPVAFNGFGGFGVTSRNDKGKESGK